MTEPPTPGWYRDPRGDGSRYWQGERWTDFVLPAGTTPPPRTDGLAGAVKPPVSKGVRVARTIGLFIVLWVVARVFETAGTRLVESATGPVSTFAHLNIRQLFIDVALFAVTGWAATKVSYRWFDFLLLFIPFYNIVLLCRLAWRLSYLPYRDWAPRPEEAASWRRVDHPTEPGALLHVVAA
jgi:hypothetical protein